MNEQEKDLLEGLDDYPQEEWPVGAHKIVAGGRLARVEGGWLKWAQDGPGVETAIAKMQQWKPGSDDDHAPDVIEMAIRGGNPGSRAGCAVVSHYAY